jgi:hypothetical protein
MAPHRVEKGCEVEEIEAPPLPVALFQEKAHHPGVVPQLRVDGRPGHRGPTDVTRRLPGTPGRRRVEWAEAPFGPDRPAVAGP